MEEEVPQSNFRDLQAELVLNKSEFTEVTTWYKEQLKKFGEMTVEASPLTDGNQ